MADMDPASLHKLRVVDLKEILIQKGLSTSGLKAELVKRLRDAMVNETSESPTEGQPADGGDNIMMQENISSDSEQLMDSREREDQIDLERQRSEDAHRRMAEEHQRRMAEERQERLATEERERQVTLEQEKVLEEQRILAEEEKVKELRRIEERRVEEQRLYEEEERKKQQQRIKGEQERIEEERQKEQQQLYAEERRREEQRLYEQEARRKEEQRLYEREMRRKEEQKLYEEEERRKQEQRLYEERRKQEQRLYEEEERRKEERRMYLEEERRKEEQRLHAEDERRKEEQRKFQEAEKQRQQQQKLLAEKEKIRLAEEQQRLLAEEQKRLMAEEQQRLLAEQKRLMAEEQQRLLAEEQQRILAEQQQKLLAEQQQKRMAEQQQKRMAEQQQKLLAEQQQKRLAEQQQKLLAEQQQKFLGEQQQKMLAHQLAPPGLHPTTMPPPPLQQFSQLPPAPPTSIVTTAMTNAFAPPPPPPPAVMNSQATGKDSSDITDKQLESKNENQVSANKDSNAEQSEEIQLPHAVEKILALKNERAQQLGIDPDTTVVVEAAVVLKESAPKKTVSRGLVSVDEIEDEELEEEETSAKVKESKSRRRKKKKKQKRSTRDNRPQATVKEKNEAAKKENVDIDIEYVQDILDPSDPLYSQFIGVFERFKLTDVDKEKADADVLMEEAKQEPKIANKKKPMDMDDDDDDDDDRDDDKKEEEKPKLSKRKLKKLSRMTVAELKQKVSRPELVEMHDVTAKDPVLLLHLKASRNTVPVPRHWCFKRKYLQGKRGIEKPAFELPDFIKRTGIMEMRQSLQEKEDQKTMKAKMRERVRPKLGKIDIDYQKLHDAFFKWQTKPKMTIHGDLYYEGKEFETRLKEKKPGDLNDDLRVALGMPTGPNANKCPPPWLIAMQRYGPPPSYPNLKIPGLNAPIPEGCAFGYHAGGWGKPPVDEQGRPLYGDVFGTLNADNQPHIAEEEIDHTKWGELESESSEEEEEDEDEDEEEEEQKGEDETGLVTPAEGLITPSGFSSIPAGMETPDMIELRKRKIEAEMEGGETPALYTILPEKKSERVGVAMMGSTHIYDLAAAIPAAKVKVPGTASVPSQGIEVALDPSELEMDTAAMAARYEQTMREQQSQLEKEDLSDMVAEHAARQKSKRKKMQQDSGKAPKKYKEFKF